MRMEFQGWEPRTGAPRGSSRTEGVAAPAGPPAASALEPASRLETSESIQPWKPHSKDGGIEGISLIRSRFKS